MAQRVQVLLVCDLHDDDTPGTETVSFGLDGSSYEIDLCDQHAGTMRDSLAQYVASARRTAGGRGRARSAGAAGAARGRGSSDRQRTAEIRRWAREQGLKVPERGRLPASIVEQYEAAH